MSSYFNPRIIENQWLTNFGVAIGVAIQDIAYPFVRDLTCTAKHTANYLGRTVQLFPTNVSRISHLFFDTIEKLYTTIRQCLQQLQGQTISPPKSPFEDEKPLFRNYAFRPRSVKRVATKEDRPTEPSIRIDSKEIEELVETAKPKTPIATRSFGAGIYNGGNSCYIAATLQMLRVTKLFRAKLQASELRDNELAMRIHQIFTTLEKEKHLAAAEINDFRRFLIAKGWHVEREYSQEDAQQLSEFLIDKLRLPYFEFKTQVTPIQATPIQGTPIEEKIVTCRSIKAQGGSVNSLPLALGKAQEKSELSQIACENVVVEEISEPKSPSRLIETMQTVKMKSDSIPHFMPISLRRFSYDPKTKTAAKIRTAIHPSDSIDFLLEDSENLSVRYRLSSIVSHIGPTPSAGHYICYVPAMVKTQKVYFEFNDSTTKLHVTEAAIKETLEKDGYVFMYELDRVIKHA